MDKTFYPVIYGAEMDDDRIEISSPGIAYDNQDIPKMLIL